MLEASWADDQGWVLLGPVAKLSIPLAVTASGALRDTVVVIWHDVDLAQQSIAVGRCVGVDDDLVEDIFHACAVSYHMIVKWE